MSGVSLDTFAGENRYNNFQKLGDAEESKKKQEENQDFVYYGRMKPVVVVEQVRSGVKEKVASKSEAVKDEKELVLEDNENMAVIDVDQRELNGLRVLNPEQKQRLSHYTKDDRRVDTYGYNRNRGSGLYSSGLDQLNYEAKQK